MLTSLALVCALLLLVAPRPAAAADSVPAGQVEDEALGVLCHAGACQVRMQWGDGGTGLSWRVAEENLRVLPGGGFEIFNDAVLDSPWGEFRLADAELRLGVDSDLRLTTARGSAAVEFPAVGSVALFRSLLPVRATIGYEPGAMPAGVQLQLDGARRYLYFDLEAGRLFGPMAASAHRAGIEAAPGQRARLVLDPVSGLVFVDGQVMLYSYGQGALVEHLLSGDLESFEWGWDALPLRQILVISAQGLANGGEAPYFHTRGHYSLDGGALGEWLGLQGEPLALAGALGVDGQALLLEAQVASSLFPEHFYAADFIAEVWVPFDDDWRHAGIAVALGGHAPWAGLSGQIDASLTAGLTLEAGAALTTHWGAEPVEYAARGRTSPEIAWRKAQEGWENVTIAAVRGYNDSSQFAQAQWARWSDDAARALGVMQGTLAGHWAGAQEQADSWAWPRWEGRFWWDADEAVFSEAAAPGIRVSRAAAE